MCILIIIGKQILEHSFDEIRKDILSGTVDENKAVGESCCNRLHSAAKNFKALCSKEVFLLLTLG